MTELTTGNPQLPAETDRAVAEWMRSHGWTVLPVRWQVDPDSNFYVWQEAEPPVGRSHALWVDEAMPPRLSNGELIQVLNREEVAEYIRISYKVRIQERGAEYWVSIVPRRSGEMRRQD
jgi:hypothetical protein